MRWWSLSLQGSGWRADEAGRYVPHRAQVPSVHSLTRVTDAVASSSCVPAVCLLVEHLSLSKMPFKNDPVVGESPPRHEVLLTLLPAVRHVASLSFSRLAEPHRRHHQEPSPGRRHGQGQRDRKTTSAVPPLTYFEMNTVSVNRLFFLLCRDSFFQPWNEKENQSNTNKPRHKVVVS